MKVVIVGTGFGERVMAAVYARAGFEIEVISPRDREGLIAACAKGADLVSIHSPPFLHHEHVMIALDHKIAVLCDKPFGRDAGEARSMRDRAQDLGVLNFLNFEFRRFPMRVKARELIESGVIGTLQHVNWMLIGNGLRHQTHRWLFEKDQAGGWIGAYGSHCIDTLRWLLGSEVADCGAILRTELRSRPDRAGVVHPSTAEDAFSAWFAMESGVTVALDTAFSGPVSLPQRVHILGSEGALELVGDLELVLRRPDVKSERFSVAPPEGDGHEPGLGPWIADVAQALRSQTQITPSFDDGLAAAVVMDSLRAHPIWDQD